MQSYERITIFLSQFFVLIFSKMDILKESKQQRWARAFLLVVTFAGESALIGQTPAVFAGEVARALWLVEISPSIGESSVIGQVIFVINGDFRLNKRFTHRKCFVHPLVILPLNNQFWRAHHVHGSKLQPKCGSCEMNSMEVKSFEISNVHILWCNLALILSLVIKSNAFMLIWC